MLIDFLIKKNLTKQLLFCFLRNFISPKEFTPGGVKYWTLTKTTALIDIDSISASIKEDNLKPRSQWLKEVTRNFKAGKGL